MSKSTTFKDELNERIESDQRAAKANERFLEEFYSLLNFSMTDFVSAFERGHRIRLENYEMLFTDPKRKRITIKEFRENIEVPFTIPLTKRVADYTMQFVKSDNARIEKLDLSTSTWTEDCEEIPLDERRQQSLLSEMRKYIDNSMLGYE